jgi:hypothetical protein
MQQPLHSSDLSTCRLCLILHPPLVDRGGGGGAPGELGKYSPDTPGLTVLEDPGVGATSPRATLLGTPAPALCTTKSCNKLLAIPPSRGSVFTTSAPVAPNGAPPAPDTSIVDATTDRRWTTRTNVAQLLSSWHHHAKTGEVGAA